MRMAVRSQNEAVHCEPDSTWTLRRARHTYITIRWTKMRLLTFSTDPEKIVPAGTAPELRWAIGQILEGHLRPGARRVYL